MHTNLHTSRGDAQNESNLYWQPHIGECSKGLFQCATKNWVLGRFRTLTIQAEESTLNFIYCLGRRE